MSWFGNQLTSFTEKITDFTKDMLPDSGNPDLLPTYDFSSQEGISFTPQQLLDLCKQKDDEITLLMNEKTSFERSIEELDTQHQEAIGELLHLKNEAVKENIALKEELTLQKRTFLSKSLFQNFEHDYHLKELKTDETRVSMCTNSIKNFNLVNIIGVLWKSFDEVSLEKILEWLKEQKLLLESQTASDSSSVNIINRINIYIEFLYLVSENPKLFSFIIDEIATVIHFLLTDYVKEASQFSVSEAVLVESISPVEAEIATSDFSAQTFIQDFKHVKNLFSTTPDPILCKHNAETSADDNEASSLSQHIQTDDDYIVQDCFSLISELKQYVLLLEQDKSDLQVKVLELEYQISNLQQNVFLSVPSSSVFIQTENVQAEIAHSTPDTIFKSAATQTDSLEFDCSNSKLIELQALVNILEQEKSDFQDEILKFQSIIDRPTVSIPIQTDQFLCDCNVHELKAGICILEQEKADLQNEIFEFQGIINRPTVSTLTQTDQFLCDCNIHELEIAICILEQEKADLQEELQIFKSLIDKPTSSVHIQTDENSSNCDLLQSEISHLQQMLKKSGEDYDDAIYTFSTEISTLTKELKFRESTIMDKENKLQFLENESVEYKTTIENLKSTLKQTEEHMDNLKEELKLNEYYVTEKEHIIHSLESEIKENKIVVDTLMMKTEQADDLVNVRNDLKLKELTLQDQIYAIQQLKCENQDYKTTVNNLKRELNRITEIQKEESKLKDSVILEKESVIRSLEKDLEKYKVTSGDFILKSEHAGELNYLEDQIKSKQCEIQENINMIQSLKLKLEQCDAAIECPNAEVLPIASVISTDTQTVEKSCSCEFYQSEILKLKKSLYDKEIEHDDMQNQTIIGINNLKSELKAYETLIADKDSKLYFLNSELEKFKNKIKELTDELNILKESTFHKTNKNSCSCKKYESEIEELKTGLNAKVNEFIALERNLSSNITNLKEILQSKDLLVINKEEVIQTLKLELDEAKRTIKKYVNDIKVFKAKQDYAKDIDTMEEHDIKMIMGNCNRCKSLLNGEPNDNDLKNEVQVLQDKLKALDMDKNQLLCVLNEKTQECSSLKVEVHKLTNIVASEKQALYKLQQDNCLLKDSRDNSDPELTKEAIQKLSRIIQDKDLEIESLKQKNTTLTTLIQDATSVPDHLQSLIEEKENLAKQINVFKADRDKIMAKYNTIDKDCRHYAAEAKKLQSALSEQKEKFDVLEQKHFSVAQQYEEKQKSLINTQNEMIALKQRVTDLEQQQVDIKEKYSELLNKFNSDTVVQLTKNELEEKNNKIVQLMSATNEKDHLIQEKDCLIHDLSQQIKTFKLEHEQQQINLSNIQIKVEELTAKLKESEALVGRYQNEKEALEMRLQDKNSELGLLKDMNERLNMSLKEKEFTVQSMTEKIASLSHYISKDHTIAQDTVDINQILADSESMFSKAQSLYKERDETLLALNQSKQENQSLRNEIQRMKSNEIHLKKELERLRMHLLEIEENYTTEALKAEECEKELRDELVEVRRRAEISNTAVVDTNQRASIQIASLQEQLSMIANQRDQALAQVSNLEDEVQQHSASVSKLQLVLEQMQRGNERKVKEAEKKLIVQLEKQKQLFIELEEKLQAKEMQLEESSQVLEAASRLSEQLDAKEEIIAHLKSELSKTESKFKSTAQEIDTIKSNTEGKVDRVVMKSLVLGYFSTPPGQKSEVIRLLARVLDFNQEEMEKAGIVVGRNVQRNEQRGLFSSIFSRLPSLGAEKTPSPHPEKSFTTLFVQFLENESQPIVPMPFPAEKMVHELSFKQHPSNKSPKPERKSLSRSNPLLLDIDSAFPTFTPIPAVEYSQSPAQSILREVLE